jgi:hypothetical protein
VNILWTFRVDTVKREIEKQEKIRLKEIGIEEKDDPKKCKK